MIKVNFSSPWTILSSLYDGGIVPNVLHRILLCGPKGTGKSDFLRQWGLNFAKVVMFPDQPETDLIGSIALRDGCTVFQRSKLLDAVESGEPVVVDEIDAFSNYCRTYLHALLDDKGQARIPLPDGNYVLPGKGFMIVATSNAEPTALPEAMLDRFDLVLHCNEPSDGVLSHLETDDERTLLRQSHTKRYPAKLYSPELSSRGMIRRARLIRAGVSPDDASLLVFGDRADSVQTALTCI